MFKAIISVVMTILVAIAASILIPYAYQIWVLEFTLTVTLLTISAIVATLPIVSDM